MNKKTLIAVTFLCLALVPVSVVAETAVGGGCSLFITRPFEDGLYDFGRGAEASLSVTVARNARAFIDAEYCAVAIGGIDDDALSLPAVRLGFRAGFPVASTLTLALAPSCGVAWATYRGDSTVVGTIGMNASIAKTFAKLTEVSAFAGYQWYSNENFDGKLIDDVRFGLSAQRFFPISR